jgi:hypothetical protein
MDVPDALQGLGLSQDQLQKIHFYFGLRAQIARKQKYALIGVALVLVMPWLMNAVLHEPADMPFQSAVNIALKWLPVIGLVFGGISLGMQHYLAHQLDKHILKIGLSARAAHRVRELTSAIVMVSIFGQTIFDKPMRAAVFIGLFSGLLVLVGILIHAG